MRPPSERGPAAGGRGQNSPARLCPAASWGEETTLLKQTSRAQWGLRLAGGRAPHRHSSLRSPFLASPSSPLPLV